MSVKQFPCQSCGAKVEFKPGTEELECPYCGHRNAIPQSEEDIVELDFAVYLAKASNDEDIQESKVVACTSCGAKSTLDPNITSGDCAFCGSPVVMEQTSDQRAIKPKSLIPFQINRKVALESFREWLGSLWFAPSGLARYARMDDGINGMYTPYWTFDSDTTSHYSGQRGDHYWETETYTERDSEGNTETKTRQVRRTRWTSVSGVVWNQFDDVLVVASKSLPAALVGGLAPWGLAALTGYNEDFLSGFRTESYTVELEAGFDKGRVIMDNAIDSDVRRDIGGDEQRVGSIRTRHDNITFKHVLLPVWISAYRYSKKPYRFLVNGQTGQVAGERPWSLLKIMLLIFVIVAVIGVIVFLANQ
jgi:DNA-directed RNA polymerase subunit RPC12/RpoP